MESTSSNDHDLLIELRTEMKNMRSDIKELKDNILQRVINLETGKSDKTELDRVVNESDKKHDDFISKQEFEPVKKLVYGCASIILTAVILALVYLVIQK